MSKSDLVNAVVKATGMSRSAVDQAVSATLDEITNTLAEGGEVQLIGFGKFSVVSRGPSRGRNPRTKEVIDIPGSRRPVFKAGQKLKKAVNGSA